MKIRFAVVAASLALWSTAPPSRAANRLQPGMRTMIQQGGVEGTVLGPSTPYPYGADPNYGYVYDDPRYGRVVFVDPNDLRRHRPPELGERAGRVRIRLRSRDAM